MEERGIDSRLPSTAFRSAMPVVVDGFPMQEENEKNATKVEPAKTDIVGLKFIFNREIHLLRRIFWACIIIGIIIFSIFQVVKHVQAFIDRETHEHVNWKKENTIEFPTVTLCSKNKFSVRRIKEFKLAKAEKEDAIARTNTQASRFRRTCYNVNQLPSSCWDLSDLIGYNAMNIQDVWEVVAQKPEDIIAECWFGKNTKCNQVGSWSPIYTYMGLCYSFNLNNRYVDLPGKLNNLNVVLNEREDDFYDEKSGWKIIIHDWVDSPVIDIRNQGITLDLGYSKDIRIKYKHVQKTNTRRKPCNDGNRDVEDSSSKCKEKCFVKTVANNITCRLPFMTNEKMKYCTTPESYRQNLKVIDNFFSSSWDVQDCLNCHPLCHQHVFSVEEEAEKKNSNDRNSEFLVFYQDLWYQVVTDHTTQTGSSLFAEIGGSLGLLLGFSVLSAIEIVDTLIETCLKCVFRKFTL